MKSAVLVIDMVQDNFPAGRDIPISVQARAVVPNINRLTAWARHNDYPVVFACDCFRSTDFIFESKLKPHSLDGTGGCEVMSELEVLPGDEVLYKRRFSAFFKTHLDADLRRSGVEQVFVCGIATHICVLSTVMDALCHDFRAVFVEDASASYTLEAHQQTLDLYRQNPLHPLLQVLSTDAILAS